MNVADLKDPIRYVLIKEERSETEIEINFDLEMCIKQSLLNVFLDQNPERMSNNFSYKVVDLPNDFLNPAIVLVPYVRVKTIQNEELRKSFKEFAKAFAFKSNNAIAILCCRILAGTRRIVFIAL